MNQLAYYDRTHRRARDRSRFENQQTDRVNHFLGGTAFGIILGATFAVFAVAYDADHAKPKFDYSNCDWVVSTLDRGPSFEDYGPNGAKKTPNGNWCIDTKPGEALKSYEGR